MAQIPETLLADLPRVVRVADETRWRGQNAIGTALVVAAFWVSQWLLGESVERLRTLVGALAVFLPTLLIAGLASRRRVADSLSRALPTPRSVVHETAAASRDRRMRLVSIILFGIIALLVFDRFTGGGGMMAGLVVGLMAATGIVDLLESRMWRAAERTRDSRLYVVVRPRALTPSVAPADVFEAPATGAQGPIEIPVDSVDL